MSDTYSYEVLEPGGHARLVGNVLDRISRASANPASAVGSSRAMLGDAETASWTERTTAADGAALIEAICGNTIVQDGSLLPVRMEGIETVGFNQWDEVWEVGGYNTSTGAKLSMSDRIRSKNAIPVFPSTEYFFKCTSNFNLYYYDADGSFISTQAVSTGTVGKAFTTTADAHELRFAVQPTYGTTYQNDICINLSDPARNGTYEPYWRSERATPVATYFPDGMRSAGSVRDELRADAAVTRVGSVDLGTLNWSELSSPDTHVWRASTSQLPAAPKQINTNAFPVNAITTDYTVMGYAAISSEDDKCFAIGNYRLVIVDHAYSTAEAFAASLNGKMMHYELATQTTTPIDPSLPLSYRTGAGGTERVMVAAGTTSAPPVFVTRYPLDPADLAASIAPRESATAEANHAVGDLIMLGWTLCKVTTAIARGEAITIGTNVTRTSVAAEIAALSE